MFASFSLKVGQKGHMFDNSQDLFPRKVFDGFKLGKDLELDV